MGQVDFIIGNGGLGRTNPSTDVVAGLVFNGIAVVGGLQLKTPYKLRSIEDAIALGINSQYDVTNSLTVYSHIATHFRLSPKSPLWIYALAQSVTYSDMVDPTDAESAIALIRHASEIDHLGVNYQPATPVTDFTATAGAVANAQALAELAFEEKKPCVIVLEGKGFDFSAAATLRTLNSEYVSVVVGQLQDDNLEFDDTGAAIGAALGVLSNAKVNECIGWVGKFDVLSASTSDIKISNQSVSGILPSVLEDLDDKGYIFLKTYPGKTGYFFNDSHTATVATSDFATIENVRTVNKSVRLLYQALLPFVNSPVVINTTTGQIAAEAVANWEAVGNKAITSMFQNQEISGPDPQGPTPPVQINPEQDVLSTSEVQVQLSIVPTGTARTITVFVGFSNPNS